MIAFAAITAVWTLGMLILGVSDALIYLAPALLILLPLLSGRHPGDEVLVRAALRGRRCGGGACRVPSRARLARLRQSFFRGVAGWSARRWRAGARPCPRRHPPDHPTTEGDSR